MPFYFYFIKHPLIVGSPLVVWHSLRCQSSPYQSLITVVIRQWAADDWNSGKDWMVWWEILYYHQTVLPIPDLVVCDTLPSSGCSCRDAASLDIFSFSPAFLFYKIGLWRCFPFYVMLLWLMIGKTFGLKNSSFWHEFSKDAFLPFILIQLYVIFLPLHLAFIRTSRKSFRFLFHSYFPFYTCDFSVQWLTFTWSLD